METARFSYAQLIRLPDVPALLSAMALGRLAARMFAIAIVFHALTAFGSPRTAGWIAFAAVAPGLVVSPLAGAFLDRVGALRGIIADLTLSAAVTIVLAGCIWTGRATPPLVFSLTAVYAMSSPLGAAGVRVLLPRLVPARALDRANALDTAVDAVVDVAGPSLAGLLVGVAGSTAAFAVIAAVYAMAGVSLALVRGASASPQQSMGLRNLAFVRQGIEGVAFVIGRPVLRGLAIGYALNMVTWGILWVAVPVSAARCSDGQAWESVTGLIWAGAGLVGGGGALVSGQLGMFGREQRGMMLCMVVTALAAGSMAVTFGLPALALGVVLAGLAAGPIDVGVLTLRQRRTDPAHLGRVLAVSMSLNLAGLPVGTALGGILVAWSPPSAFLAAALASLLGALAIHVLIPTEDLPGRRR
jgi:hypothetical protein